MIMLYKFYMRSRSGEYVGDEGINAGSAGRLNALAQGPYMRSLLPMSEIKRTRMLAFG
jgi:hypothetical protein